MKTSQNNIMHLRTKILVSALLLCIAGIIPVSTLASGSCICYDSDDKAVPEDPTAECEDICLVSGAVVTDQLVCECPDRSTHTLTCEDTCMFAGLSVTPGASPSTTTTTSNSTGLITPVLNVDIPGLDLTDSINIDGSVLNIDFMGVYIAAFYKYLIGLAAIAAIVMIMIGGLQYSIAGGYGETSKAKTRIKNAVIGLVLLMGTWLILWTVNPELVALRTVSLENVAEDALEDLALESCKDLKGTVSACSVQVLTHPSGWSDSTLTDLVNQVAIAQGVDPIQLATHLEIETSGRINYNSTERGPCGEIGVAQFMPSSFETTVNMDCCLRTASIDKNRGKEVGTECDEGYIEGWPPDTSLFGVYENSNPTSDKSCKPDICGTCQVALDSCAEYFDTTTTDGLRNTIEAQAKFVARKMSKTGDDRALAMCAYNGSGAQAAAYAQKAASIYKDFCQKSGGTN